ncbi:MAG TPA: hypothetical protein P5098_02055 [Candidatus Dojkabacteria bacterium]|nr:hypothetical protein [Candidatus Dojkabacteria bacterium]
MNYRKAFTIVKKAHTTALNYCEAKYCVAGELIDWDSYWEETRRILKEEIEKHYPTVEWDWVEAIFEITGEEYHTTSNLNALTLAILYSIEGGKI